MCCCRRRTSGKSSPRNGQKAAQQLTLFVIDDYAGRVVYVDDAIKFTGRPRAGASEAEASTSNHADSARVHSLYAVLGNVRRCRHDCHNRSRGVRGRHCLRRHSDDMGTETSGGQSMTRRVTYDEQTDMGLVSKNFVPALPDDEIIDGGEMIPLPAQQTAGIPIQTQPIVIDSKSNSFRSIQGSYGDATQAFLLKFVAVLMLEACIFLALAVMAGIQALAGVGVLSAGWLVLTAIAGLLTFVLLDRSEQKHTPIGAERHRVDRAADVAKTTHKTTVEAWRDVNMHSIDAYYSYLERAHERNSQKRLESADRKRLTG